MNNKGLPDRNSMAAEARFRWPPDTAPSLLEATSAMPSVTMMASTRHFFASKVQSRGHWSSAEYVRSWRTDNCM